MKQILLTKGKIWRTRVKMPEKTYTGYSFTEKEAALKYNELALKYFGEFARVNIL